MNETCEGILQALWCIGIGVAAFWVGAQIGWPLVLVLALGFAAFKGWSENQPKAPWWDAPGYVTGLDSRYIDRWLVFLAGEASKEGAQRSYRRRAQRALERLQQEAQRRGHDLV